MKIFRQSELGIIISTCLFMGGIFFHSLESSRFYLLKITEPILWVINLYLIFQIFSLSKKQLTSVKHKFFLIWFLIVFVLTLSLEIIGTKTGLIFGDYQYGTTFFGKFLEVPVIIGLNWVLIILGCIQVSNSFLILKPFKKEENTKNTVSFEDIFKNSAIKTFFRISLNSLLVAILAVSLDYFLEPVAIFLDYWTWADIVIPFQNYLAWFCIAFISAFSFYLLNLELQFNILKTYFWYLFLFFLILNVILIR